MAINGPTINFGGLASGLDTNSIVDQLMALERQPQNRLKLKQGQIDARKTALGDVASRLKNLRLAAQDLKSATLWLDTQSVDVNDATKLAAVRTGSAATGSYQVAVTQMASAYQHWYTYSAPAADDTLDIGGRSYNVAAGSDLATVASTINSDASAVAYASVVTDANTGTQYLALSSKKTGSAAANDFTLTETGSAFSLSKSVAGLNATGSVNGQAFDEATNTIADAIPGVTLTLKGLTGGTPATLTVGAPGPDQGAISAKVKAFVEQYNSTVDFIRSKLSEKPVVNPQTASDYSKGVLYGDTTLTGLLGQLRIGLTAQYGTNDGNPLSLDQLAELGVSTGSAVGGGTLNHDAIAGKLTFDATKFSQAMAADPLSVRRLLGGSSSVTDNFAKSVDDLLAPMVQADGTLDQTIKSQDAQRRVIADQIARMDQTLAKKQDVLKRQFAAMEAALQASQSQGQWLSGQLN